MNSVKARFLLVIGVVGLVVVLLLVNSSSNAGKIRVNLHALPEDVTFSVDGEETGGSIFLKPGAHTFAASKEGFETEKYVVSVSLKTTDLYFVPQPVSESAKAWANQNDITARSEAYAGQMANIIGKSISDESPITTLLPHYEIAGPYSIDYGLKDDNSVYLLIGNSTAAGRQKALQWLQDSGYKLSELDIRFDDFVNPTTGEKQ
ncbi:hypothetical protein CR973_01155 [Candidatus Saccharibacteria bacterium]|nr:MAG: hypothetical protein CR973_01155 [Candidatus Saccharibacteria bacterium]